MRPALYERKVLSIRSLSELVEETDLGVICPPVSQSFLVTIGLRSSLSLELQ